MRMRRAPRSRITWRTAEGADATLQLRDGRWAGIEVKLGQADVDAGARSHLRVAANVDPARHGAPAFLAVVTGWVMPIGGPTASGSFPPARSGPDRQPIPGASVVERTRSPRTKPEPRRGLGRATSADQFGTPAQG